MSYIVDKGNECVVWTERKLKRYYAREIDHTEYATFEDWMWDMMRSGLVTEIIK